MANTKSWQDEATAWLATVTNEELGRMVKGLEGTFTRIMEYGEREERAGLFVPKKPCPFCACPNVRIESWERGHTEYAVMCLNCGAFGPNDLGKSGAVEAWDMRREEYPGQPWATKGNAQC